MQLTQMALIVYLKAMPKGAKSSLRAGMLAPPVSGIHHCLEKMTIVKQDNYFTLQGSVE